MNIQDAKEQIKNAMTAYFTKDEFGNYRIPIEKQRPVLLMGPPGIGKTAVMEQIASEYAELGTVLTVILLILGNVTFFLLDIVLGRLNLNKKQGRR